MSDILARWKRVVEGFTERLNAVDDDQWNNATPCAEFTVRQLVEHSIDVQRMIPKALGSSGAIDTTLDSDPKTAWETIREAALTAYTAEGALERTIESPLGTLPAGHVMAGPVIGDLLIHTWDLARAIGADDTLPEDICRIQFELLQPLDGEMLRQPGRFGPKIDVPAGANAQTALLCFAGRQH